MPPILTRFHIRTAVSHWAISFPLTNQNETRVPASNPTTSTLGDFVVLAKPRITALVLVTTALGFFLGGRGIHSVALLLWTLLGTALVAGGAAVLNHYFERGVDADMLRTRDRPLASGRLMPTVAMTYGLLLLVGGLGLLLQQVNMLTAFLALSTAFLYVVVYTPLKRLTWWNTSVGSIPGALPPGGGWTAASGELELGAWALFAILFAWQHPHFYAIAWIFKDDYRRGGFKMLPVVEPDGKRTCRHIVLFSVLLIAASTMPTLLGLSGGLYLFGALLMGTALLTVGIALSVTRTSLAARRLLKASVVYLPILLVLTVLDSGF